MSDTFTPQINRQWLCLLAMLIALLTLSGCQQAAASDDVLDSTIVFDQPVVDEIPAPTTYRIGINTEVTGTGAQIGDLSIRAARLAIEEINSAGGVNGIPLELVVRDARSDPQVALAEYRQAVANDDLIALLGPFKSAYGVLIVPEHRYHTLPMFIGATNATLTQQGVDHLFRMRPSDRLTAPAMVTFALDQLGAERIGLVHDTDAFGSGGANRIEQELASRNLALAARVGYQTGATDFDDQVQQLAAANVDTVLIYGTNQTDVGYLLRSIRYRDLDVPVITSPSGASVVTRNVAGEAQDGLYAVIDATLETWPRGIHFQQTFRDRFGLLPDTYIIWYYDAIHLLADILRDHPDARGESLSRLIRQSRYEGAQGVYCFDDSGEGLHFVTLARIVDSRPAPLGTYSDHQDGYKPFSGRLAAAICAREPVR